MSKTYDAIKTKDVKIGQSYIQSAMNPDISFVEVKKPDRYESLVSSIKELIGDHSDWAADIGEVVVPADELEKLIEGE